MTDIENVLSSMSTAFNSSPTPGDEASVIDLNNDKTLKWRRHFKNQYAKKNPGKSLGEDDPAADVSRASAKPESPVDDEDKGQAVGVAATPKTPAPKQSPVEERTKSTPPSTPEPAPASTATAAVTSTPLHSVPARSDNDLINAARSGDETAEAASTSSAAAARAQKPKVSNSDAALAASARAAL